MKQPINFLKNKKNKEALFIALLLFFISGCCKGRGYITSEEGGIIGIEINVPVGKEKVEQEAKKEVTYEQKKELATIVGVILPDMTKEEVLKTLGEPRKTGFSASTGQEVWYYKAPEEQNIYFKDDKVERVEYLPKEEIKPTREIKQPEEI